MNGLSFSEVGYLLFVIPGFIVVWTVRHFTGRKPIGEFEYAVWSAVWGAALVLSIVLLVHFKLFYLPDVPLDDPSAILGAILGSSLVLCTVGAPVLGYFVAFLVRIGLFRAIDRGLNWVLDKATS